MIKKDLEVADICSVEERLDSSVILRLRAD
jgi:hypothetical protein